MAETLSVSVDLRDLAEVYGWVDEVAQRYSLPRACRLALQIVAEEAVSNIIRHGFPDASPSAEERISRASVPLPSRTINGGDALAGIAPGSIASMIVSIRTGRCWPASVGVVATPQCMWLPGGAFVVAATRNGIEDNPLTKPKSYYDDGSSIQGPNGHKFAQARFVAPAVLASGVHGVITAEIEPANAAPVRVASYRVTHLMPETDWAEAGDQFAAVPTPFGRRNLAPRRGTHGLPPHAGCRRQRVFSRLAPRRQLAEARLVAARLDRSAKRRSADAPAPSA